MAVAYHLLCSVVGTPFYVMTYTSGHIYTEPTLPDKSPAERRAIYSAMSETLAAIHSVDIASAGLEDYGKHGQNCVCERSV